MSSIPNLNTLLRGRGGPRLRGRRGGGPEGDVDGSAAASHSDKIVQQTDNDASSSRLSAIELGYLQDDYARALSSSAAPAPRRYPIINRGTYVRTTALDKLVERFLRSNAGRKQIVSLGAGSDTRYFRLLGDVRNVVYHELDFGVNIAAKRSAIQGSPALVARRQVLEDSNCTYHLHAVDLRTLKPDSSIDLNGLELNTPTLVLSECCLCYLPPDEAVATMAYFSQRVKASVCLALYEPIRPYDAFGRTMVSNLASRGIHLQTLQRYASLEAQRQRLKQAGLIDLQGARDVFQIWSSSDWVSDGERERIDRLEWLDEIEEWKLLASHYCIAWACKGEDIVAAWHDIPGGATHEEMSQDSRVAAAT